LLHTIKELSIKEQSTAPNFLHQELIETQATMSSAYNSNEELEFMFGDDWKSMFDIPDDEPSFINLDFTGFNNLLAQAAIEPIEPIEPVEPVEPIAIPLLLPPPPSSALEQRIVSLEALVHSLTVPPPAPDALPTSFRRTTKVEKEHVFEVYNHKRVLHERKRIMVYLCKTRIAGIEYKIEMLGKDMVAAKFPRAEQAKKAYRALQKAQGKKRI
jgi:hypothetical protein